MIIDKIKRLFGFKSLKHSHYFHIYETKKKITLFFMHDKLTKYEKLFNETSLKETNIVSIKQAKKVLFRFLKNNLMYEKFINHTKKNIVDINYLVETNFITPFSFIIYGRYTRMDDIIKFRKLNKKWINFLKSINYIKHS